MPRPGPGEIRVRVTAASLNYRDLVLAETAPAIDLVSTRQPCSLGTRRMKRGTPPARRTRLIRPTLTAPGGAQGDYFGCSVALSNNSLIVGAYEYAAIYGTRPWKIFTALGVNHRLWVRRTRVCFGASAPSMLSCNGPAGP